MPYLNTSLKWFVRLVYISKSEMYISERKSMINIDKFHDKKSKDVHLGIKKSVSSMCMFLIRIC